MTFANNGFQHYGTKFFDTDTGEWSFAHTFNQTKIHQYILQIDFTDSFKFYETLVLLL